MMVPPEVLALFDGQPEMNSWEPVFQLLTVDEAGFPHVCLLSRMELEAGTGHIYAVLASETTTVPRTRPWKQGRKHDGPTTGPRRRAWKRRRPGRRGTKPGSRPILPKWGGLMRG